MDADDTPPPTSDQSIARPSGPEKLEGVFEKMPALDDGQNGNGVPTSQAKNHQSKDQLAETRELPHNLEAEQALLGSILIDNEAFFRISDILEADHFFDPLHQRIFHTMSEMIKRGQLVTPVTLKPYLDQDPGMQAVGGTAYLARLASAAPTIMNAPEYARIVFELFQRRGLMRVGEDMVTTAGTPTIEDSPAEQIQEAEQQLYSLAESGRYEGGFYSFADAAEQSVEMADRAYQKDGGLSGISTGFIDLDRMLGGMHPSDLVILAGRPSMGKTSLATNIAFNAAKQYREGRKADGTRETAEGAIVAFFSLEMSSEQLATRILSEQSGIPSNHIRKGDVTDKQFREFMTAQQELQNLPLYIDDTGGLSIAALSARSRRLRRQKGLDLIVVDYLQLVTTSGSRRNDGRVQEVSAVTQGLKALAKELNVPVMALSQLSRKVEDRDDKKPQLSDLRESGSIEQDADVVMFVYREEYYVERSQPSDADLAKFGEWKDKMNEVHGLAEVIIGKQRHGPTGTVQLQFDSAITKFGNRANRDYPEGPGY